MASITKRGSSWRAMVYVNGTRESKTFITKAKAEAWAAMRETQLRTQAETGILSGKTCADAFDRYAQHISPTKRGERFEGLRLNALKNFEVDGKKIGDIQLVDLTPEIIGKWRDIRLKTVAGSTVNRELNLLSNVLTIARREWRWIAHNPTADVRRPKDPEARDRRITNEEIERICIALGFDGSPPVTSSQRVAVAFLFAIETGMRAGEICALKPAWIDGNVAHLRGDATKNGLRRSVPLSSTAVNLLKLLANDVVCEQEPIFGLKAANLDAIFRKGKKRAGIEDLHFHDTRHEAITRLSVKLDVLALARMVGHQDLKMLNRYYNKSAADIAAMLNSFPDASQPKQ